MNGDISVLINLLGGALHVAGINKTRPPDRFPSALDVGHVWTPMTWSICVTQVAVLLVSPSYQWPTESIRKTPNGSVNWVSQRHQAAVLLIFLNFTFETMETSSGSSGWFFFKMKKKKMLGPPWCGCRFRAEEEVNFDGFQPPAEWERWIAAAAHCTTSFLAINF